MFLTQTITTTILLSGIIINASPAADPALDCTPAPKTWYPAPPASPRFFTQEICDGLYAYGSGLSMGMLLVTDTGVIFVDAPSSLSDMMPSIAATVTTNPITTVIYSHHHSDHIGGAYNIPNIDAIRIVCHKLTLEMIETRPDLNIPLCTDTFAGAQMTVNDGNQRVSLSHTGYRWHTNNDIFIFAEKQRTIMVVDLVFPKWIPFKNLALASNPDNYRKAHQYLLDKSSARFGEWLNVVAGHMDQIGTRADVYLNMDYYDELQLAGAQAASEVSFYDYGSSLTPTNTWTVLKQYINDRAERCADIMGNDYGWDTKFIDFRGWAADNCAWSIHNNEINFG